MTSLSIMKRSRGVTLIELMIVVVVVAILTTIAYPSYRQYAIRANRTEAKTTLMQLAADLEKCHTRYNTYDSPSCTVDVSPSGLQHYDVAAPTLDEQAFLLTATPKGGQAEDTDCGVLSLDERGTKRERNGEQVAASRKCW